MCGGIHIFTHSFRHLEAFQWICKSTEQQQIEQMLPLEDILLIMMNFSDLIGQKSHWKVKDNLGVTCKRGRQKTRARVVMVTGI